MRRRSRSRPRLRVALLTLLIVAGAGALIALTAGFAHGFVWGDLAAGY